MVHAVLASMDSVDAVSLLAKLEHLLVVVAHQESIKVLPDQNYHTLVL